ncbi:hypothetical protein EBB07_00115 [Paenibacillaceae bacterium]|nr:hypothetical protein EBB07_00115 [Paenibacillaceae bacterium]
MKIIGVKYKNRNGDHSDFVVFELEKVNYITVDRPQKKGDHIPIYHTTSGSYAPITTLKDISVALGNFGFDYIDQSTIVNAKKIKRIEETPLGKDVTFVDNTMVNVSKHSRMNKSRKT